MKTGPDDKTDAMILNTMRSFRFLLFGSDYM